MTVRKCFLPQLVSKYHQLVHTNENLFECHQCKQDFAMPSDFISHQKSHCDTLFKAYVCDYCKKCFSQSSHLIAHKTAHTAKTLYECDN